MVPLAIEPVVDFFNKRCVLACFWHAIEQFTANLVELPSASQSMALT